MLSSLRRRLTYSNVVASAALFIALGGVSYAASLPRNSVGTVQLKANAVTSARIKNNTVGLTDMTAAARTAIAVAGPAGATGAPGATGPAGNNATGATMGMLRITGENTGCSTLTARTPVGVRLSRARSSHRTFRSSWATPRCAPTGSGWPRQSR